MAQRTKRKEMIGLKQKIEITMIFLFEKKRKEMNESIEMKFKYKPKEF